MKIDTPYKTPIRFFSWSMSHQESKSVSQNLMGIAITTRPLQFPGFGDLQGTIKIFPVLRKPAWPLCTFIGHRGAENKIPPPKQYRQTT